MRSLIVEIFILQKWNLEWVF